MTALSGSFATNRRSSTLEGEAQFSTPLQPLLRVPSTLELLAELQSRDDSVSWVLALCYDRPAQAALFLAAPERSDGVESGDHASGPGIVLDGNYKVVFDDEVRQPHSGWLHRSVAAVAGAWATLQHERQIRQSVATVSQMDDRTLKDIGIYRGEIEHVIRHGREKG